MASLNFPTEWRQSRTTNTSVTHCFETIDNGNKTSRILMTIRPYYGYNRGYTLNDYAWQLAGQIDEEKMNMVEKNVKLQYIQGQFGTGVYFMATDKNYDSQKDDYPFMMRCCYVSRSRVVEITVLCQNKESNAIKQVSDWLMTLQ